MHGFTRDYIVSRAMENVNNTSLTTVAQNRLDIILHKLYTEYQWDFLRKSAELSFAVGATGPTGGLPSDYHRQTLAKWKDTTVSPAKETPLSWIPPDEYLQIADPGRKASRPLGYTIDPVFGEGSSQVAAMKIYPTFEAAGTVILFYYYVPAVQTGNFTPVFPDHAYLIAALTNELYAHQRDGRYNRFYIEETITVVRRNLSDQGIFANQVPLDPRHFRAMRGRSTFCDPWPK